MIMGKQSSEGYQGEAESVSKYQASQFKFDDLDDEDW
jgi:hypothetical protein